MLHRLPLPSVGAQCQIDVQGGRADLFYANAAIFFALMSAACVFGSLLVAYYFRLFVPAMKTDARNPQVVGLIFITCGTGLRAAHFLMCDENGREGGREEGRMHLRSPVLGSRRQLISGPTLIVQYLLAFTAYHLFYRLFYGLYYPFVIAAFTLQVFIWIDVATSSKTLQKTQRCAQGVVGGVSCC